MPFLKDPSLDVIVALIQAHPLLPMENAWFALFCIVLMQCVLVRQWVCLLSAIKALSNFIDLLVAITATELIIIGYIIIRDVRFVISSTGRAQ